MVVETEPVIWLALLPTAGGEAQADGSVTAPGVHLRWSFAPELGFPQHGFVVERRLYSVLEIGGPSPRAWELLPHGSVASPFTIDRATLRARMAGGLPPHVLRHVDAHLPSLQQLLEQAADVPPSGTLPVHGGGVRTDVRPLDLLLIGALDATLARGLGLYLLDGSLRAGTPADYRVTGNWGSVAWPQRSIHLERLLRNRSLAATGFFQLDWLTLFTSCACVADADETSGAFLRLTGQRGSELRLVTEHPVGELELDLASGGGVGGWQVSAATRGGRPGEPTRRVPVEVQLQRQASSLLIRSAAAADRFDDLTLTPEIGGPLPSTLHVAAVQIRRARGIVGDRVSLVARATPLRGSTIEEESVAFPLAQSAKTPALATVRPGHVPPSLGPDGTVRVDRSQADLVCRPQSAGASEADNARAVRLDVGYRHLDARGADVWLTGTTASSHRAAPIARWPLSQVAGASNTPALVARGAHAFTSNRSAFIHDLDLEEPTLQLFTQAPTALSSPGFLECALSALPALDEALDDIHMAVWVAPVAGPALFPTLVGMSYRHSLWLGLERDQDAYRPRCWINGHGSYRASLTIPGRSWSRVGLGYDGQTVRFFVDGAEAGTSVAAHGALRPNPRGSLCIGADPQRPGVAHYPFSGFLADLSIWHHVPIPEQLPQPTGNAAGLAAPVPLTDKTRSERTFSAPPVDGLALKHHPRYAGLRAAWPLDGQPLEVVTQTEDSERGRLRYTAGHPLDANRKVLDLDGNHVIEALGRVPEFYTFGGRLLIKARVFPDPVAMPPVDPLDPSAFERPTMTILSADKETSFAFGLQAHGLGPTAAYRPTLYLGGVEYPSTLLIPPQTWSSVAVVYDGSSVRFFLNGRPESDRPQGMEARLGPIGEASDRIIRIGGEVDPDELQIKSGIRGRLADVEIWDTLPRPRQPLPSAEGLEPAADYVADGLEDGRYGFWARGVDLFGRVGPKTYADASLDSFRKPPAPTTTRARFLPVRGSLTRIVLPTGEDPHTRLALPLGALGRLSAPRLVGYDVEIQRPTAPNPISGAPSLHVESLEILTAEPDVDSVGLSVRRSAFSLLDAAGDVGRSVEIPADHHAMVEWTWTGAQRLFAPEVVRFRLAHRVRGAEVWLPLAGAGSFALVNDEVARDFAAEPLRAEPVTHAEWRDLQGTESGQLGLSWLPEPTPGADGTAVYRVSLPAPTALAKSPHRLPPEAASAESFVLGALVAFDETAQPPAWQLFQVHWHEWEASRGWTLVMTRKRSAEEARAAGATSTDGAVLLRGARFYPGQRYRVQTAIDTGVLPEPTVAYEVTVHAVARRSDRTQESEAAAPAALVAVDRHRPPTPPRPRASIDRGNVHGRSAALVEWDLTPTGDRPAPSFLLYRAVDSAVHSRDVELRRTRSGHYQGLSAEQIFADDVDFADWIAEAFPDTAADWSSRLFAPKPESFSRPGQDAGWRRGQEEWRAASVVWRAWSARFHAGLTAEPTSVGELSQLQEIAERAGMEAAFSLVAPAAVASGPYRDEVNGSVRNAYLYRLRTQSPALVASSEWGGVSPAAFAPKTRPPRAPSFTKVEAGDRQVTLHFVLIDEFDLAEYRLYRARDRESLLDLRWWTDAAPDRVSYRLPDPLLRTHGNALQLPLELAAAEIVTVYRLADVAAEGAAGTDRAFNLYRPQRARGAPSRFEPSTGRLSALSPMPDGLPVAVVFRDASGTEREIRALAPGVFLDTGLTGLADYFYALTAVDNVGLSSPPSKVVHARAPETAPPTPPAWASGEWVSVAADDSASPWVDDGGTTAPDAVALSWEPPDPAGPSVAQILVQRQSPAGAWVAVSEELPEDATAWRDTSATPTLPHDYRLLLQTAAGNVNRRFEILRVERARTEGGG